jgi:LPS export ABC transporter protein LptC
MRSFLLSLLIILALSACENDIEMVNKITSKKEVEIETGEGIEILYSSNAKIRAKLQSPQLKRNNSKNPYTEFDKGLVVFFYDEEMKQISKLTAKYGRINEKDNTMIVRDNVEVINIKNEKLNTEELTWDNKTRKIYTEKFVKIQTNDELIFGDGMEANEDLTNYKIKKLRGTVNLKDNNL